MSEQKKTMQERRADSDQRIIASAIKSFGTIGYTYSSIRDIAQGAGVTSGLITQRYGSKENLFLEAFSTALKSFRSELYCITSPRDCLISIVRVIQHLSLDDEDAFNLYCMLHNSTDYPKEILKPYHDQLKSTREYMLLCDAQKQGMLPPGDLDVLLASFGASVFHNTALCKRYGIEYTAPERFLEFIRFSDKKTNSDIKWHRVISTALVNTFDLLIYMNLQENHAEILKNNTGLWGETEYFDFKKDIVCIIDKYIPETEKQKVKMYTDPDTLGERMKGRKSLSFQAVSIDGSTMVNTYLPISWDSNGNLIEVFAGIYTVRPNTAPDRAGWQKIGEEQ